MSEHQQKVRAILDSLTANEGFEPHEVIDILEEIHADVESRLTALRDERES